MNIVQAIQALLDKKYPKLEALDGSTLLSIYLLDGTIVLDWPNPFDEPPEPLTIAPHTVSLDWYPSHNAVNSFLDAVAEMGSNSKLKIGVWHHKIKEHYRYTSRLIRPTIEKMISELSTTFEGPLLTEILTNGVWFTVSEEVSDE